MLSKHQLEWLAAKSASLTSQHSFWWATARPEFLKNRAVVALQMATPSTCTPFICLRCLCEFGQHPSPSAPASAVPCGHMFCKACMTSLRGAAPAVCSLCTQPITSEVYNIAVGSVAEAHHATALVDGIDGSVETGQPALPACLTPQASQAARWLL